MNRVTVSVEANGERGEDGAAITFGTAVDRRFDVLEAGLNRNPMAREERQMGGATSRESE